MDTNIAVTVCQLFCNHTEFIQLTNLPCVGYSNKLVIFQVTLATFGHVKSRLCANSAPRTVPVRGFLVGFEWFLCDVGIALFFLRKVNVPQSLFYRRIWFKILGFLSSFCMQESTNHQMSQSSRQILTNLKEVNTFVASVNHHFQTKIWNIRAVLAAVYAGLVSSLTAGAAFKTHA